MIRATPSTRSRLFSSVWRRSNSGRRSCTGSLTDQDSNADGFDDEYAFLAQQSPVCWRDPRKDERHRRRHRGTAGVPRVDTGSGCAARRHGAASRTVRRSARTLDNPDAAGSCRPQCSPQRCGGFELE
jgi:hypothetical protein